LKYTNKNFETQFKNLVVVRSFCFGLKTLSPFGINRQKQRLGEPFLLSPPMVQVNMSVDYTKVESGAE
jgi:hypothetical protein